MLDKMFVYNHLPVWGQNLACYVEGKRIVKTRYGKAFWKYLSEYEERNTWPYEKLCEFRDRRLSRMIKHCYATVPYYTKLFDEGGVSPERIKHLDDLKILPVLTKEIINKQPDRFLSTAYPMEHMIKQHTSGTTGAGLVFKTTQKAICEQWAVWWRYRKKLGIDYGTLCALFGGRSVVPVNRTTPPFYRINKPCEQVYFSAYHMNNNNMPHYIDALEKYKPIWIHGYPSSISFLAQYMIENDVKLSYDVQWITTGAENLHENQKNAIQKAFGIYPYQHYGMTEGVANISENIHHKYMIDEDYAAVEFLRNESIDTYRIVGTSLTNYAMPLLRYEVGDNAVLEVDDSRSVLTIDGRKEDYLVLSNGVTIGRLDHIFKDMVNVKEAQIFQDIDGKITFYVVRGKNYKVEDENRLHKEIKERIGSEPYQISYKDKIARTKSGKIRFVISERTDKSE